MVQQLPSSLQARRHLLADQANAQDQQLYETKQAQLEHEIEQANVGLETNKTVLQTAREDKKRKLQYEVTWHNIWHSHGQVHTCIC